ncbi:MAG TPA: DNA primase [Burkholderiaceae bacterium]|nr:DNA primase [Burkholderiaceae bacterium]
MIPQGFITDLLHRVDIVEIVGRYVQLKKGGANFLGLCPFHNERSPSFTVSPSKQFFHCFGCGASGNAIGFLMEYSGLSFPEAVEELAQGAGLSVPREQNGPSQHERVQQRAESVALTDVLAKAAQYYREQLRGSPRAIEYVKNRGLTGEIARRFGLGYAPDRWDALNGAFSNYAAPELVRAGLVISKEDENKRYDRFRDRIMFPIRNTRGDVIAFGGRVLDRGEPKYLNSPETAVFQKGSELYGLFEARQAIRERGYVLVVEGYMDVVALAQLGFANAVATLGTACSSTHIVKLLRQTDRIVFSFDGDAAGRKAAWRALEASLSHAADDKLLSFLFLPSEHDPDSFVRERGAEAFEQEVSTAVPLSRFLVDELQRACDVETAEGRARLIHDAVPLLKSLPDGALRMQLVESIATQARQPAEAVAQAAGFKVRTPSEFARRKAAPARISRAPIDDLEMRVLRALVAAPELLSSIDEADRDWLASGDSALADLVQTMREVSDAASPAVLATLFENTAHAELFKKLAVESLDPHRPTGAPALIASAEAALELQSAVRKLRLKRLSDESTALAAAGLHDEGALQRFKAITAQQTELRRLISSSGQ